MKSVYTQGENHDFVSDHHITGLEAPRYISDRHGLRAKIHQYIAVWVWEVINMQFTATYRDSLGCQRGAKPP